MKYFKNAIPIVICLMMAVLLFVSCKPNTGFTYDPSKNYATFLVLNSDAARASLEIMKKHSTEENLAIGPVAFYDPDKADYQSLLRGLTTSKQVTVVWIISGVWDIPAIKKAMAGVDFKGAYRYAPVSGNAPIKIDQ